MLAGGVQFQPLTKNIQILIIILPEVRGTFSGKARLYAFLKEVKSQSSPNKRKGEFINKNMLS